MAMDITTKALWLCFVCLNVRLSVSVRPSVRALRYRTTNHVLSMFYLSLGYIYLTKCLRRVESSPRANWLG
jgi:hypothetical protein